MHKGRRREIEKGLNGQPYETVMLRLVCQNEDLTNLLEQQNARLTELEARLFRTPDPEGKDR